MIDLPARHQATAFRPQGPSWPYVTKSLFSSRSQGPVAVTSSVPYSGGLPVVGPAVDAGSDLGGGHKDALTLPLR